MNRFGFKLPGFYGLSLLLCGVACGGRPHEWDVGYEAGTQPELPGDPSGRLQVRGLTGSVAMMDPLLNEVMMFTSPDKLALVTTRLPVGRDVAAFETSADRERLFVLSRGVTPRYKDSDEAPQLRVFDGGIAPKEIAAYDLQDPYDQLKVDPLGQWLIVHGSEGLVSNSNELILVELPARGAEGGGVKKSKTLDSYGGKPKRFVFTSELSVPGGDRHRLLIVEREKDLAIIDLNDLDAPEITVGLPQTEKTGAFASPAGVVFHDEVAGEVGSMLAVQLEADPNVYILSVNAPLGDEHAFSLDANLVNVGGVPTAIDFVQTKAEGGLRLAALVPSKLSAKLIDPASSNVTDVALPAPFSRIRRITGEVQGDSAQDVALLYGESTNTIAFWQLGATAGTPYRSIDAYDLGIRTDLVLDVPGAEFANRKILSGTSVGSTEQFYVLDLSERKSFPLDALNDLTLNLSPSGKQLWAFRRDATGFAQLTFDPLQPASLYTQKPIAFVHDFRTQRAEDERSTLVLHLLSSERGHSVAATLFDGNQPNTAKTKFISELELMGVK
jgi:hypothetical protein